ncbi:MAG: tripartite tricarboxylate transporter permease [Bacillota bacterium]
MNPDLLAGFSLAFTPEALLLAFLGMFFGIIVGAVPGLTATMAIAILTPFTFSLSPINGLLMLVGIYIGGVYGGCMSAILLNIPGTPSALMTALDGHPMANNGQPGRALGIATISSALGGLIGTLILLTIAPFLARFALKFGAAEYFALCCFGLSVVAALSQGSLIKGFISAGIGLFIVSIGMDPIIGVPRFTYGSSQLLAGLSYIPIMIGLFGIAEVLTQLSKKDVQVKVKQKIGRVIPTLKDLKTIWKIILRCAGIGTFIGALPGAGGAIGAILGYNEAKRTSKYPEKFGSGVPEGIAAPEAANNSAVAGAFIPLLTLGIPGDAITAILIGAFMIHNLTPGPLLYKNNPEIIYALYFGLLIAHVFLIVLGMTGARLYAKAVTIRNSLLMPIITLFCIVGSFAYANRLFDVMVMLAFGILGYFMRRNKFPIAPMILGIVLGPIFELNLRVALQLAEGNVIELFTRPISAVLWILLVIMLLLPKIRKKDFQVKNISTSGQ